MDDITVMRCDTRIIYEKVCLKAPLEQRRFFNFLDDTCLELLALCSGKVKVDNYEEYKAASRLSDYINIKGIYIPAIVNNILFLAGMGEQYKSEYIRTAQEAAKADSKKIQNKIIKRGRW